jgi:hypothetical protein
MSDKHHEPKPVNIHSQIPSEPANNSTSTNNACISKHSRSHFFNRSATTAVDEIFITGIQVAEETGTGSELGS